MEKLIILIILCGISLHLFADETELKISCHQELREAKLRRLNLEMTALMCSQVSKREEVAYLKSCHQRLLNLNPARQSNFDTAILCSGVKSLNATNLRINCLTHFETYANGMFSPRDGFILCGNIQTKEDLEKAETCYKRSQKRLKSWTPQDYAILCGGGKR